MKKARPGVLRRRSCLVAVRRFRRQKNAAPDNLDGKHAPSIHDNSGVGPCVLAGLASFSSGGAGPAELPVT